MKKMKIYISGAMTGVEKEVYMRRFREADDMLSAKGWKTVNPSRFIFCRWNWLYKIIGYRLALLIDLWMLSQCHGIYIIPEDRYNSKGVKLETAWASIFGLYELTPAGRLKKADR